MSEWMFAALSTVEPPIVQREIAMYLERDKTWYEQRLPIVEDRIRGRLDELSNRLGDADWLDDAFSAGDLLMVQVLRRVNGLSLLEGYPNLSNYVACFRRSVGGFHWPAVRPVGRSDPTIYSSRRRFAARLNSGVMPRESDELC